MKEVIITINESDITSRIFTESGYTALARAKSGIPERFTDIVQATDDEHRIIKSFITDSINEVASIISRFMSPCSTKHIEDGVSDVIYIKFTMPNNSPDSMVALLKECICSFSTARSLQWWMLTVKPDEANTHIAKAQNELARMRELLSSRTRPVKTNANDDNIVEL